MDNWKTIHLKIIELGGNKRATEYYEKNGMIMDGRPNHKAPQLARYKQDILKESEKALGGLVTHQEAPVATTTPAPIPSQTLFH
jgi:hypothetical protein